MLWNFLGSDRTRETLLVSILTAYLVSLPLANTRKSFKLGFMNFAHTIVHGSVMAFWFSLRWLSELPIDSVCNETLLTIREDDLQNSKNLKRRNEKAKFDCKLFFIFCGSWPKRSALRWSLIPRLIFRFLMRLSEALLTYDSESQPLESDRLPLRNSNRLPEL